MASKIQAINTYRPKLNLGRTVLTPELVEFMAMRTGMTTSQLRFVLSELHEAVIYFNRRGQGVKIEGLATYLPKIGLDGTLDIEQRLDRDIRRALNKADAFWGEIINKQNIGKRGPELVALWNEEHPDDPVR